MPEAKLCSARLLLGKLESNSSVTSPRAEDESPILQVQLQAPWLLYSSLLHELGAATWQAVAASWNLVHNF